MNPGQQAFATMVHILVNWPCPVAEHQAAPSMDMPQKVQQ